MLVIRNSFQIKYASNFTGKKNEHKQHIPTFYVLALSQCEWFWKESSQFTTAN